MEPSFSIKASSQVKAFSQTAISNNQAVVEYCRTSMAALSGGTAGILGLSTLFGFAFYGISVVTLWLLVLWKVGLRCNSISDFSLDRLVARGRNTLAPDKLFSPMGSLGRCSPTSSSGPSSMAWSMSTSQHISVITPCVRRSLP